MKMPAHKTWFEAMGDVLKNERERAAAPSPAPTKPVEPRELKRPEPPDATQLTRADLARCMGRLGIDAPMAEGLEQPGIDARESARLVRRFERRLDRYERSVADQRATNIAATAINGTTATADEVSARLGQLGIGGTDRGRILEPQPKASTPTRVIEQKAAHDEKLVKAHEVAVAADKHLRAGKPLDVKKLSPEEFKALARIRGLESGW